MDDLVLFFNFHNASQVVFIKRQHNIVSSPIWLYLHLKHRN